MTTTSLTFSLSKKRRVRIGKNWYRIVGVRNDGRFVLERPGCPPVVVGSFTPAYTMRDFRVDNSNLARILAVVNGGM